MVEAVVPASYADVEVRERLSALRKIKSANVAKTVMARWLLKIVFHVLKESRPYMAAHPAKRSPGRLLFALASSKQELRSSFRLRGSGSRNLQCALI